MDKLEVLARAWIDCDPNRAGGDKGSGWHPDDIQGACETVVVKNEKGAIIGVGTQGVSGDLQGTPYWRWFVPRAVALEQYLEERGYVIVKMDQVKRSEP